MRGSEEYIGLVTFFLQVTVPPPKAERNHDFVICSDVSGNGTTQTHMNIRDESWQGEQSTFRCDAY